MEMQHGWLYLPELTVEKTTFYEEKKIKAVCDGKSLLVFARGIEDKE